MQFSIVAVLALAGSAFAATSTLTDYSTEVVTITSCASTVTDCPARTSTTVHTNTYTSVSSAVSGAASASGTGYTKATLTSYSGPAYTGAAGQVKVAGALAGVGAFAALLL